MKKQYEQLKILIAMLVVTQITSVANADLVAHWKFDETSGNIAADSSGNGYSGTLHGEPVWGPGKVDGALEFDGSDDFVELPIGSIINSLTNSTFATWVNFSNSGDPWQRIFDFGSGTAANMFLTPRNVNNKIRFAITTGGLDAEQQVSTSITLNGGWHHIVLAIDANNNAISLYLDTKLVARNTTATLMPRNLGNTTQNWLGRSQYSADAYFTGSLDDFRIYNHTMSHDEVVILYCRSFFPPSDVLSRTAKEAEAIIKNQNPKQALDFIEKKISEYKEQIQNDDSGLAQKAISSELYLILAEAEEVSNVPKEHVVTVYKRAVESGGLFTSKLGTALLWLYENVDSKEYESIVQSLIDGNSHYLQGAASKAEEIISEKKFRTAIEFLEANLNPYTQWLENHPTTDISSEQTLPRIYFLLAGAKEDFGSPKKEIAEAYSRTLKPSQSYFAPEWSNALIWLMENGYENRCAKAIESFVKEPHTEGYFKNTVSQICQHFEKEKNQVKFHWFLDTLFTRTKYPSDWALFVQTRLAGTALAQDYDTYLNDKPRLRLGMNRIIADKYAAEEKFTQAAEIYRDIVSRCGPEDDKAIIEFKFCKCIFKAGRYQEVVRVSDNFISSYKSTHRNLVKEAMLMKGRALIQLAETEKAIESLLTFLIEYPDSNHAPETNFILGYCYMLQSRFKEATEAFNLLRKDYPESSYAAKAESYLQRIKNMTE